MKLFFALTLLFATLPAHAWFFSDTKKGLVEVSSLPGGAQVLVDGKRKGNTPTLEGRSLVLELPAGGYVIEARLNDGRTAKQEIFVGADTIQPLHMTLIKMPEMVAIPPGCFQMGKPVGSKGSRKNTNPQHKVCIDGFELGKYEVTLAEWDACVVDRGCDHHPEDKDWGRGKRPAINISWDDIQQYIRWLNQATGHEYRLPSEAEWEYAYRAGTTTRFYTGNCIKFSQANYHYSKMSRDYLDECDIETGESLKKTQPVGSYPSNPWGLHDMAGNVLEWVEDCYHESYQGAPTDGSVWETSCIAAQHVVRGGHFANGRTDSSAFSRWKYESTHRYYALGFRLARSTR